MFAPKQPDADGGMMYVLEHKPEYEIFGGIGGGSSYKFYLYYSADKKSWISGKSKKDAREVSEDEAIIIAKETRTKLQSLCDYISKLGDLN
jgi:hypothetical protein